MSDIGNSGPSDGDQGTAMGWSRVEIPEISAGFFADDNRVGVEAEISPEVLEFIESISRAGAKWVLDEDGLSIIAGRKYHGMEMILSTGEEVRFRIPGQDRVEFEFDGLRFGIGRTDP